MPLPNESWIKENCQQIARQTYSCGKFKAIRSETKKSINSQQKAGLKVAQISGSILWNKKSSKTKNTNSIISSHFGKMFKKFSKACFALMPALKGNVTICLLAHRENSYVSKIKFAIECIF